MKALSRRTFLGITSTALAGLALPLGCLPKQRAKDRIGVALLGLGGYSTYQLAPALSMTRHCELAGIVTGSPEKIPRWQREYGIEDSHTYSYDTMHEIANDGKIDVIYIVTPTGTHADFVIKAADTGKHVWCEKPMAMNAQECQSMIDACRKNGVQLTLGYRMQHEPNTQTLNSYGTSLPFGAILRVDAQAGYYGGGGSGWRFQRNMGGGALYDMGVYTVNGMRNALHQMPKKVVSAKQFANRPNVFSEVDETTTYVLEFEDGLRGYGRTSVGESINHLKVTCEDGFYELSPMQTYSGVRGKTSDGRLLDQRIDNQQARQMDDDALALLEGKEFMIQPEEGLKDIQVIEAIIKSAATGREVVI